MTFSDLTPCFPPVPLPSAWRGWGLGGWGVRGAVTTKDHSCLMGDRHWLSTWGASSRPSRGRGFISARRCGNPSSGNVRWGSWDWGLD